MFLDEFAYLRPEFVEFVAIALGYRAGNDQRGTGVVDQHRIHLVHNGVVMGSLHEVPRGMCHVVPQVVESEFVIRSVGDVRIVSGPPAFRIGPVLIDTVH